MGYATTTSLTTLAKLGRKVQGNVLVGFQKRCEEWGLAKTLKNFELDMSQREVTTPIDIIRQPSGSFIPEGGYEAIPRTEAPQELTFTWANYNDRFSFTKTSEYLDRKFREAELIRQAIYQTGKMIEGLTNRVGWSFYGTSDGVMAWTSTNATQTSGTYALTRGFGQSWITDTTYLASMFQQDDYVALIRSAAVVTNSVGGQITAVPTASGLAITFGGSVDSDANDAIVLANSAGHTLITGTVAHTDYNKAPSGILDFLFTTSVQGLSGGTYALWNPAYTDTSGGVLTGTRIMKGDDLIGDTGGGQANTLILSKGVYRNLYQNAYAGVQYNDPLNMQIVGSVKTGSFRNFKSRKVPPGFACLCERNSFINKWTMVEMPGDDAKNLDSYENANTDKLQDQNASVFSFDFPFQFVTTNRANSAVWTGLSES